MHRCHLSTSKSFLPRCDAGYLTEIIPLAAHTVYGTGVAHVIEATLEKANQCRGINAEELS